MLKPDDSCSRIRVAWGSPSEGAIPKLRKSSMQKHEQTWKMEPKREPKSTQNLRKAEKRHAQNDVEIWSWKKWIKMGKNGKTNLSWRSKGRFLARRGEGGKTLGHIWLTSSLILHAVHPRRGAADVFWSKSRLWRPKGRLILPFW